MSRQQHLLLSYMLQRYIHRICIHGYCYQTLCRYEKIIFYTHYVIVKMKLAGYDLFGLNELSTVR